MDVGAWLRGIGLGQYEDAFRENEIDATVLPDLTADDLKELGVAIVGHRRKILAAIAKPVASSAAPVATGPPPTPTPAPADAAERRQLTVMFSDLVGSTALSARLDPEDMRQVIRAYQDACSGVVARYDGFVAKFMGDGILAYFGFPHAHEDDAARAVHAGLEISEVVAGLQTRAREKLAVRVGIATGLVVVGDLVGQGSAQEQAVVGDTPNLAARLQGLAEAGGVVVAAATRRLLGDRFRLRDLGRHVVKGLAEPVEAWAALGVSASDSRFDAAHAARLTGFVGREAESADLLARQRRAWAGQGQIVLISGEAGIGKSRFSAWLAEQVADRPHTRLRYQCSPYHRDSALYPFVQQLERAAGIAPQENPEVKLDKLEKVLGLATDRMNEVAPLIASMLSIPLGQRYRALNLSPAQQRRQTLSALLDQMEGLARKQPVLMLFEDAHWADATSLEVLDLAIERVRRLPVLLLVTFRPEFEAPWTGLPDVATITLQRLDRTEAETLVERVTGGRKLPAEVMAQIVAKTDGVPLFVEELTKNVLESGLLIEDGERYRLDGPLPPLAIPSTLQDSLMARLDRLAAVKEIAQIGAAIGREFSYLLLHAVVGRDEATLRAALAQLEDSELVFRSGEPPAARYAFKHALVQDTAYESLLKSRRQILHRRIAETLREKFAAVAEAEPELLAHHFTQAGLTEPAIEYWGKAGDLALRRSAFKEAIAHLGKAIDMTEAAGAGEKERPGGRLRLQVSYGNAMIAAHGHAAPETAAAFRRAHELAAGHADVSERHSVNYGLWAGSYVRGELAAMRKAAEALLGDCASQPRSPEAGIAHRANGVTLWFAGNFVEARAHLEQALAIFEPERDRDLAFRFGQDVGVSAMAYLAIALWPLGEVDRARELVGAMATRAEQLEHLASSTYGLMHNVMFEIVGRNAGRAAPIAKALSSVAHEHGIGLWISFGAFAEAWVELQSGLPEVGLSNMRRAADLFHQNGVEIFQPLVNTSRAEAEARTGETEAALASIEQALADSHRTGQRWFDAETHRIRGEILLRKDPSNPAPAEECFLTAIAIAHHQKARSFELRAALCLAKLYRATGRDADAHAALGPALEGFAPTAEFQEIAEAQALFDALAQTDAVKAATASRKHRVQLQVSYGNALIAARGHGAAETTAAFERARELAAVGNSPERFSAAWGLWVGSYIRGELEPMRESADEFMRGVEARPDSPEAGVAHRVNGITAWFAGDFVGARAHFERALAIFDPQRDAELAFRFGQDQGVSAMAYLTFALWPLGEVDRTRRLIDDMIARMAQIQHVATTAYGHSHAFLCEMMGRNFARAAHHAGTLAGLARDHDMELWKTWGVFYEGWTAWQAGDRNAGLAQMRRGAALLDQVKIRCFGPFIRTALAEAEAETGETDAALATIDQALTESARTGHRWFDAETHRTRGEILLKKDASNPAPAKECFLTAVAIAQAQKARSFELRAALSLARLYRASGRDAEAHAALGPALEGFAPTPEFPEIAEAQALMAALAQTNEVKAATALRKQRVDLHMAYGAALLQGRGLSAPETKAAFERARELSAGDAEASRPQITFGLWAGAYARGELGSMRTLADAFQREVAHAPHSPEAGVAHRVHGVTKYFAGDFLGALTHLEQAVAMFDPARDGELALRFTADAGVLAMAYLAKVLWAIGEVDRARRLSEDMTLRIAQISQVGSVAYGRSHCMTFEMMRGDFERAAPHAEALAEIVREHDLAQWQGFVMFFEGWKVWRIGNRDAGVAQMRRGVSKFAEQKFVVTDGLFKTALAEAEAESGEIGAALSTIDSAIAESERTGQRTFDAEVHRTRGEILLKQDAANPAPAEDAFLAAIAIAQAQKARSFELRAALALAKLYGATGRDADAHAVLGPALEGFAPTPEFPEIAEAQALFDALAQTDEVKAATASRKQRVQLQIAYGNALIAARGYGAPETKAAFERARELAAEIENPKERFSAIYGLWVGSYIRSELGPMRELAAAFLRDAASPSGLPEASVAHRVNGITNWFAGEFVEARAHHERALAIFDPSRDGDLAFRFGHDPGVGAMACMSLTLWPLGEIDRARQLVEDMTVRLTQISHIGTVAFGNMHAALLEMMRRSQDFAQTARLAKTLAGLARDHDLQHWRAESIFLEGLAAWQAGDRNAGLAQMRRGVAQRHEQNIIHFHGILGTALAEAEAEAGEIDGALATLAQALTQSELTGERCYDAETYRIRGEILLKKDASNPAAAEEAFLAAIAIAQAQKARSFELRAALALAKLYCATGRDADAHAVLGRALEGFAPTPEFPEIGEARALLATLAWSDPVRAASAMRWAPATASDSEPRPR